MTKQISFSKFENELLPDFRKKISSAESVEDVKKFYVYTMQEFFSMVFPDKDAIAADDIRLVPDQDPPFSLSGSFKEQDEVSSLWHSSDLFRVLERFAVEAAHRYRHLEKNPMKTEAKIRN